MSLSFAWTTRALLISSLSSLSFFFILSLLPCLSLSQNRAMFRPLVARGSSLTVSARAFSGAGGSDRRAASGFGAGGGRGGRRASAPPPRKPPASSSSSPLSSSSPSSPPPPPQTLHFGAELSRPGEKDAMFSLSRGGSSLNAERERESYSSLEGAWQFSAEGDGPTLFFFSNPPLSRGPSHISSSPLKSLNVDREERAPRAAGGARRRKRRELRRRVELKSEFEPTAAAAAATAAASDTSTPTSFDAAASLDVASSATAAKPAAAIPPAASPRSEASGRSGRSGLFFVPEPSDSTAG